MTVDALLARARRLWVGLAGVPVDFDPAGLSVVTAPHSGLCPPGWVGVVALGDAAIATAPDDATAATVGRALAGLPPHAVTDPALAFGDLPVRAVLGPAALAYGDAALLRPAVTGVAEAVPVDRADVAEFLARVPAEDAGIADVTSPLFVARAGTDVVAAAGYTVWAGSTAHVGVLTAPGHRGRGLARAVASAAVAHALAAGLLAQWRARVPASRRVARALGFVELGAQLSVRLGP